MPGVVFVDVSYRGLELGRRLKLHQVGPRTAYLEHGTPMPVGAPLRIATDEGLSIPVMVVRVHEQVAGAELPPGMRVRAEGLEGQEAAWWKGLESRDQDPEIPEADGPGLVAVAVEAEAEAEEAPAEADAAAEAARGAEPAGQERQAQSASRTIVMTSEQIRDATGGEGGEGGEAGEAEVTGAGANGASSQAGASSAAEAEASAEDAGDSDSDGGAADGESTADGQNGESRGGRRGRRRRRRR